ncbi:hypothetical protein ATANTOWER_030397 [Ataeniobius toweri]|uniref:Uncharacterized protein n=1 Tax=Ataeniobius toweri TaxID=208326 RepID=A0ABU7B1R1_9TELE|nr:hypothetical protein [Ataeniobius toweri]
MTEILRTSDKTVVSEEDSKELELDKAWGAFEVQKETEQREKCSKYFFSLEKRNFDQLFIEKLKINNVICKKECHFKQCIKCFSKFTYCRFRRRRQNGYISKNERTSDREISQKEIKIVLALLKIINLLATTP